MANSSQTLTRPKIDAPLTVEPADSECARLAEHFESVYREAAGDPTRIPWQDDRANPALVCWLNAEAPRLVRPGVRAVVVGCGLADDVVELETRGYDALGFDISSTCVSWARERHPRLAERLLVADASRPPLNLVCRFELVVECYTIQVVPPSMRSRVVRGIVSLAKPHGVVVAIARARPEGTPVESDEPPYPLTRSELVSAFEAEGFAPVRAPDEFEDDTHDPPVPRLRCAFRRA